MLQTHPRPNAVDKSSTFSKPTMVINYPIVRESLGFSGGAWGGGGGVILQSRDDKFLVRKPSKAVVPSQFQAPKKMWHKRMQACARVFFFFFLNIPHCGALRSFE